MSGNVRARAWLALGFSVAGMVLIAGGSALGQPALARFARPAPPATVTVTVRVLGLRNDRGHVMGALFDRPERWVRAGEEVARCREAIREREARCVMSVHPGRYAFAFAHDEDGDGRFDRDVLGIPSEGYGFSNDVRPSLSLPSWDAAAFSVRGAPSGEVVVRARYGI